jgi:hypothetical protein
MSFDIDDLMRIDENGKGYVNILLTDIQDKPKLFSLLLCLSLLKNLPTNARKGDADQPELVILDEST